MLIGRLSVKPWCYWLRRLNNSPIQDYVHPDGHAQATYVQTQSVPTARTVSTLHTVKTVLWPYRPYDCTDSAVVTLSAQKQPEVFIQPISEQLWKGNALPKYRGFFFHFFKIYRCVVLFFPFQYAYFWLYSWVVSMSVSSNGIELINVILFFNVESVVPSIAQLVERRTVERMKSSLGRWFESGSKEWIFLLFFRAVEYTVPALRRSYWFWEISDFVFYCNYSLVYD